MKIVQAHNFYQISGGEDIVVKQEKDLLEARGHEVVPFYKYNDEIKAYSALQKLKLFSQLAFNNQTYRECVEFLETHKPDICHVHNTLHLISPSIFKACKATGTPVVQTMHNYRAFCANGMLTKNNKPCEVCLGGSAYQSVKSKCYRGSYLQTYSIARMLEQNKKKGLLQKDIDAFICFTDFAKQKFIEHGIPAEKIYLKSNFINDLEVEGERKVAYIVFAGRLEQAKGAHILKSIAAKIKIPLYVIGEGPFAEKISLEPNIKLLGKLPHDETLAYIQGASALVFPSTVYEGMPMAILEAFAHQTPVIASNLGAMASMIKHGKNGLLFEPGNADDASNNLNHLLSNLSLSESIAKSAFCDYQEKYSAEAAYKSLMAIYQSILEK